MPSTQITPRQVSPLPEETSQGVFFPAEQRQQYMDEFCQTDSGQPNPVHQNPAQPSLFQPSFPTHPVQPTPCLRNERGSFYIRRKFSQKERVARLSLNLPIFQIRLRRSARIALRTHTTTPAPCTRGHYLNRLEDIQFDKRAGNIVQHCPEVDRHYSVTRWDWEIERRNRRIFERDFPRYNYALNKYLNHQTIEPRSPQFFEAVQQSQDLYTPEQRDDLSPTPGFTTSESELESCSETDLFGFTVYTPRSSPSASELSILNGLRNEK